MHHRVPDFHELEDDDSIQTPSISRPEKPTAGEEEIMELLWKNGHVVVQSQNQRSSKRSASGGEVVLPAEREIRASAEEQQQQQQQRLFMQEDELSWLHYPLDESSFDGDFYTDLLNYAHPPPTLVTATAQPRATAEIRPPPPILSPDTPRVHNFVHFSRLPMRPRMEAVRRAKESTVVESNETPALGPESRVSHLVNEERAAATTSAAIGELASGTCELTITSSPEASPSSFSEDTREPQPKPSAPKDRKRKAKEAEDTECQSEDFEFEAKKQARGSASTKRSRAAEVHNLSERRRRDRINEKMRALQDLIPRCNKSDKASMLDEAIEYLKSLQLQVQMMSMGCGMVPMMYPRMNQYMPAMGMGLGMGMNRPMVPYPPMMPNPAAHMAPPFPLPPPDPHPNSTIPQLRVPGFVDPYRQYLGFHHMQLPLPQNQDLVQRNASKPSTNNDICNPEDHVREGSAPAN